MRQRGRFFITCVALGCLLPPVALPHRAGAAPTFAAIGSVGTAPAGYITEASGLVASRQNAGVLWTHNDDSFRGHVFALSTNGAMLADYIVPGATSGLDFEDLAIGPGPDPAHQYLYLGDIGDNASIRPNIRVYRFPEPAVYLRQAASPRLNQSAAAAQTIVLAYPDGAHNAEAMMVDPITGDLFIVTKLLGVAGVYRATAAQLDAGGTVPLSFIRQIPFEKASAADISADGRLVAIRRGNKAAVWVRGVRQNVGDTVGGYGLAIPVIGEPAELNGESLGFHPGGLGYYTLGEGMNQPIFFFRRIDAGAPRQPVALIGAGEAWRFVDQTTNQGTAWRESGFDDAVWPQGPAQLGYGQGDERTTLASGSITKYFRKTFTASAPDLSNRLVLRLCFTDGAAVYLNGTEVLRRNLAPDATFDQAATNSNATLQNYWSWFSVNPALLVPGVNTLAVELHRLSPGGSTLSFDAQLISGAFDHIPDGTDPGEPADSMLPRVTITAPAANVVVTNEVLTVRGTAADNIGLARVAWRVGTNAFQPVTGTTAWSIPVPLAVGTNVVEVIAHDFRTNASVPAMRQFIRRAVSPLLVQTTGQGTVTPGLNGLSLLVGNTYTLTATPAARNFFAGWSGGVASNAARLTFLMESNLVLRANFVTNPFVAAKGAYRGLFEDSTVVSHDRSGALTVTVTERGTFTAALRLAGRTASVSGQFDLDGKAERTVTPVGLRPLTVLLCLDLTNGTEYITGQVAGADWTAPLLAYRPPVFNAANPAPFAGRYTMQISGSTNETGPLGHGVAALVVAANGQTTLTGTLADGTKLAQAAPASRVGLWPLYLPLYANRGSVLGWLMVTNIPAPTLGGYMNWVRPTDPLARPLPAGFTNVVAVSGSGYSVAAATNFLNANSNLCLTVRGLTADPVTNCLRRISKDTFAGAGFRSLKLDLPAGLWTGLCTNPATGAVLPARFTVLLPGGAGFGHVLGTNVSAAVASPTSP